MDQQSKIDKVYPTGERRVFLQEKDGDWKLEEHTPAQGQKKIRPGRLMQNCPPPHKAEAASDVE